VLALFTFGVIQAPDSGWGSPLVVCLLASAAVVLGLLSKNRTVPEDGVSEAA